MDHTKKEPEAIADARGEVGIEMVPNGPGKWKLNVVAPEGLEIRPGDVICIGNVLLDELKARSPDGSLVPVKFEADKSSMTKKAAKAK
jgi:invasion protein IalB